MNKLAHICAYLEEIAPVSLQEDFDNCGLLVGDREQEVTGILLCFDLNERVIQEAIDRECNLIVSHHPLIFHGLKAICEGNNTERSVRRLIQHNIAYYAAHTNADSVWGGVSHQLAARLQLQNVCVLAPKQEALLKLVTFVPPAFVEALRDALFEAGAGSIGNYDCCSYSTNGVGTFRANEHTHPFVGEIGTIHQEVEQRLELIVPSIALTNVMQALKKHHPYEEPAYDIIALKNSYQKAGLGVIGEVRNAQEPTSYMKWLKESLALSQIRYSNPTRKQIKTVALCGGSGAEFYKLASAQGADLYITGDVKYHDFQTEENGTIIADIGHYESEVYIKEHFYEQLTKKMPNFAIYLSEYDINPVNYL